MRSGGDPEAKRETLRKLIRAADGMKNAIVFCNRKRDVAVVHKSLVKHGFNAGALHGDMDQTSRTRTLDAFRANELTVLVASDVAARGLDIPDVSHVFNFDVPHHADDYVHRIGRTGRAGRSGWSITIVSSHDTKSVSAIEKLIGRSIPYLEAIEAIATAPEERAVEGRAERPRREGRGERGRQSAQTSEGTQPMPTPARAEEAPRPERPARVARNEPERTKPAGPMNERQRMPRDRDQASLPGDDAGHMPAFLLRMKRTAPVKKA